MSANKPLDYLPNPYRAALNREKFIVILDFIDNYKTREIGLSSLASNISNVANSNSGSSNKNKAGIYAAVFLNEKYKVTPVKPFSQNNDPLKLHLRQRVVFIHDRLLPQDAKLEENPGGTKEKMYCEIMIFETNDTGKPDLDNDKKIGKLCKNQY